MYFIAGAAKWNLTERFVSFIMTHIHTHTQHTVYRQHPKKKHKYSIQQNRQNMKLTNK